MNILNIHQEILSGYRGRQGADVGMLIRRIKSRIPHPVTCIGTSATMVSKGSSQDKKQIVAEFASKIFGEDFSGDQIISEELERSLEPGGRLPNTTDLREAFQAGIDGFKDEDALRKHPTAIWLENAVALKVNEADGELERAKPLPKTEIASRLVQAAELNEDSRSLTIAHLDKLFLAINELNQRLIAHGNPEAVRDFIIEALTSLYGAQMEPIKNRKQELVGFRLYLTNLPSIARTVLPVPDKRDSIQVSFESPTPEGFHYLGRNHPFVEQICQRVLADTMERNQRGAARAAVFRSSAVERMTTLMLFRVRNVIEEKNDKGPKLIAEEMLLWGYRGHPGQAEYLELAEARRLLSEATVDGDLSDARRQRELGEHLQHLDGLRERFDQLAEERSKHLVEAHERFSRLVDKKKFEVVYPVLPMDVLGVYILVPNR